MTNLEVRRGYSLEADERRAVQQIAEAIRQPDARLGIFFCSSSYDLDRVAAALGETIDFPLIGCTTAGEISSQGGFTENSIVAASLAGNDLYGHVRMIPDIKGFNDDRAAEMMAEIRASRRLGADAGTFGIALFDGLSMAEEQAAATLYTHLDGAPLVGGSAGDDMRFRETQVYAEGHFQTRAAAFCLVETRLPFITFKSQHFIPTRKKMVITESDPAQRRVTEIDGEPAAEAYARLVGVDVTELGPAVFSQHPVILSIGGDYYVRSISRVDPDGSLVFFCAIDTGLVLTLAEGVGLVENLETQLASIGPRLGGIGLVLGCNCILRLLEMKERGLVASTAELIRKVPFLGFSTYGEQFNAIHVNQTITGVAIGNGAVG